MNIIAIVTSHVIIFKLWSNFKISISCVHLMFTKHNYYTAAGTYLYWLWITLVVTCTYIYLHISVLLLLGSVQILMSLVVPLLQFKKL